MTPLRSAFFLAAVMAFPGVATVGSQQPAAPAEPAPAAMILMAYPERFGDLERPPVVFDHARHTTALGAEECTKCHLIAEDVLTPSFAAAAGDLDPGAFDGRLPRPVPRVPRVAVDARPRSWAVGLWGMSPSKARRHAGAGADVVRLLAPCTPRCRLQGPGRVGSVPELPPRLRRGVATAGLREGAGGRVQRLPSGAG